MLLDLPAKMKVFADNLIFDMFDFSFPWTLLQRCDILLMLLPRIDLFQILPVR